MKLKDKILNELAKYKIFRIIFRLPQHFEYDELEAKLINMRKPFE